MGQTSMTAVPYASATSDARLGERMHALATRLYPICRSITGDGVRASLRIIGELIPLVVHEVQSGTEAFDWTVPPEWNIRDAYVANAQGERVIDFRQHNLHVVQYSLPVRARMTLDELRPRLHTLADRPDVIPYRTSYYADNWGFCLTERQLSAMKSGEYEVVIDASLQNGSLTYGELFIPGDRDEEVLVHTHVCHPSLANDNLSGMVVTAFLAEHVRSAPRRYSYRFLFQPGTIGAIAWLALNEGRAARIRHGLVITGVGDPRPLTYKRSRRGDTVVDRAMQHLLKHSCAGARVCDFEPYGYDERQYCSPGFNLPVGTLMRTPPGSYPEYHTSADNLDFIRPDSLEETLRVVSDLVDVLETDRICVNTLPKCEPQLGKRGLYRSTGGAGIDARHMAMLWLLNLSDGSNSVFEVAERSGLAYGLVEKAATELEAAKLLHADRAPGAVTMQTSGEHRISLGPRVETP